VTVVASDGVVVPGNKNIGLLRFNDSIYSFSGKQEALAFAKNPMKYIEGLVDRAKTNPEMIQLLHLYQYFPTVEALERVCIFILIFRRDHSLDNDSWGKCRWSQKLVAR
jgi:hypothetical protein